MLPHNTRVEIVTSRVSTVPSSPNYSYRGRTSTSVPRPWVSQGRWYTAPLRRGTCGNGTNVVALGCLVGDCKQSPCTINRHPTVPKKLRRHVNKQARRSKKTLNIIPAGKTTIRELSGDDLVKVASDVLLNGKYQYLTRIVKKKPEIYIMRLFHLTMRFDV